MTSYRIRINKLDEGSLGQARLARVLKSKNLDVSPERKKALEKITSIRSTPRGVADRTGSIEGGPLSGRSDRSMSRPPEVLKGAGKTNWRNSLAKTAIGAGIGAGAGSLIGSPLVGAAVGAALSTPRGRSITKGALTVAGGAAVGGAIGAGAAVARNFPTSAKTRRHHRRSPGDVRPSFRTMREDISKPDPKKVKPEGRVDRILSLPGVKPAIGAYLAAKAAQAIAPKDDSSSSDVGRVAKGVVRGAAAGLGAVTGWHMTRQAMKKAADNKLPSAWNTDLNQLVREPFATIKQKAFSIGSN